MDHSGRSLEDWKAERSIGSEGLSYEGSKGSKDSIGSLARGRSDHVGKESGCIVPMKVCVRMNLTVVESGFGRAITRQGGIQAVAQLLLAAPSRAAT